MLITVWLWRLQILIVILIILIWRHTKNRQTTCPWSSTQTDRESFRRGLTVSRKYFYSRNRVQQFIRKPRKIRSVWHNFSFEYRQSRGSPPISSRPLDSDSELDSFLRMLVIHSPLPDSDVELPPTPFPLSLKSVRWVILSQRRRIRPPRQRLKVNQSKNYRGSADLYQKDSYNIKFPDRKNVLSLLF